LPKVVPLVVVALSFIENRRQQLVFPTKPQGFVVSANRRLFIPTGVM
jgi:hypothetical protein